MSYKSLMVSRKSLIGLIRVYNKWGIHDRKCAKYSLVKPTPAVDFEIYCPRSALSVHCEWFISLTGEFCRNIQGLYIQLRAHRVLPRIPHPEATFVRASVNRNSAQSRAWARRGCVLSSRVRPDRKKKEFIQTLASFQITLLIFLFLFANMFCVEE